MRLKPWKSPQSIRMRVPWDSNKVTRPGDGVSRSAEAYSCPSLQLLSENKRKRNCPTCRALFGCRPDDEHRAMGVGDAG